MSLFAANSTLIPANGMSNDLICGCVALFNILRLALLYLITRFEAFQLQVSLSNNRSLLIC
jgi:hypothetical protein